LNITLITSQLLTAPALWNQDLDLRDCRRIFSVFYTAALQVRERSTSAPQYGYGALSHLSKEEWTTAVVKGADEKSPRWRHTIVLGGILLGFEEKQNEGLPTHLRGKLEAALISATNLALRSNEGEDIGRCALAFVLNHTFELLAAHHRAELNYDLLLQILVNATFLSKEGLEHGYWLSAIDGDVVEVAGRKFNWSAQSRTYRLVRAMQERPLVASLGPMSRLIAHSVESTNDPLLILDTVDRVVDFARTLSISWRQNKLSEVDVSEESEFLDAESLGSTLPTLWQLLRVSLFATVIILRAVMGRLLGDPTLSANDKAPFLAMQCLHVLRNLYFVSCRLGQASTSQYVFVNMVAIDILSQYPKQAENFIRNIRPTEQNQIPPHPADRCLDLFFFNTAEHFTLTLSPELNEDIVLSSATPYLAAGGNRSLMEIFEAAHSLTLSILAGPQNSEVTARHLPFYLDALFRCFPESLSSRQFRLAFKTIVRVTSPPSSLAQSQPLLPSILMDTIFERTKHASKVPIEQRTTGFHGLRPEPQLSEQAVLVMAAIDSLCFLHPALLEEWLPLTALLISQIEEPDMRIACQDRFWEAMSSGEMDIERAALCVAWWSSRGGREQVFANNEALQGEHVMTGALPTESKL
jgi:hypothetical protein